nr:MAG TPA: hypothetical protein [Caudoviricetes sp.]
MISLPHPFANKSKNTFRFVSCGGIEPPTPSITPELKQLGATIQLFTHSITIALRVIRFTQYQNR